LLWQGQIKKLHTNNYKEGEGIVLSSAPEDFILENKTKLTFNEDFPVPFTRLLLSTELSDLFRVIVLQITEKNPISYQFHSDGA
jgi:hypothetical protein